MSIYIMARLFKCRLGSQSRKMLAVRLADFADDDGKGIWPSVETLACETELSERTVQRILAEFVAEGLLVVVRTATGRPGIANEYDFDLRKIEALPSVKPEGDGCHHVTRSSRRGVTSATETGDTDDRDGCHRVTRTVIEPLVEPLPERDARELDGQEDIPGKAAFEKRVMRFVSGEGFVEGEWPKWTGSSPAYIARQFAKLTSDERKAAESNRDAFLAKCRRDKTSPIPVGNYFRDKAWGALSERDMAIASENAARKAGNPSAGRPDGWKATYSREHTANYFRILLAGPDRPEAAPENGIWFSQHLRTAWPRLFHFWQQSEMKGGLIVSPTDIRLAHLLEFVPADTDAMDAWQQAFRDNGWPTPRVMDSGAYFPRGGPAALDGFIVSASMTTARNDDDAA